MTKYLKTTQLQLQDEAASTGAKQHPQDKEGHRQPAGARGAVSLSCCSLAAQCPRTKTEEEPGAKQQGASWSSNPSPPSRVESRELGAARPSWETGNRTVAESGAALFHLQHRVYRGACMKQDLCVAGAGFRVVSMCVLSTRKHKK